MLKVGSALLAVAATAVLATQPARTAAASQPAAAPVKTLTVTITGATTAPRNTDCQYTAQVSGGTPPYFFAWMGVSDEDTGTSQTATARWPSVGEKALWVDVWDSRGNYEPAFKSVIVVNTGSC